MSNAELLARLESRYLDISEDEPIDCTCSDNYLCVFHCDDRDDDADSWELAVREERERFGD